MPIIYLRISFLVGEETKTISAMAMTLFKVV